MRPHCGSPSPRFALRPRTEAPFHLDLRAARPTQDHSLIRERHPQAIAISISYISQSGPNSYGSRNCDNTARNSHFSARSAGQISESAPGQFAVRYISQSRNHQAAFCSLVRSDSEIIVTICSLPGAVPWSRMAALERRYPGAPICIWVEPHIR